MSTNPLGDHTVYPEHYDPTLLYPIARSRAREQIGMLADPHPCPFFGQDRWTCYELSWLDEVTGCPAVAGLEILVPCVSENIVESKSLKLYLNSFYGERTTHKEVLGEAEVRIAEAVGCAVDVRLMDMNTFRYPSHRLGVLPLNSEPLEQRYVNGARDAELPKVPEYHDVDRDLLALCMQRTKLKRPQRQSFHTHVFRSVCPVTGQPDWATVGIVGEFDWDIDRHALLRYLVSYRHHRGFHEEAVERIYHDIMSILRPSYLRVEGLFTRRGGIDINPLRCSIHQEKYETSRTLRQ